MSRKKEDAQLARQILVTSSNGIRYSSPYDWEAKATAGVVVTETISR
jgi:hypothetical protein